MKMNRISTFRKETHKAAIALLSTILLLAASAVGAQEIPPNLQAAIFFKVLSFDKKLPSRSSSGVVIAVVTDGSSSGSKGACVAAFKGLASKKIKGKSIKIVTIDFADKGSFVSALESNGVNVIYLANGSSGGTLKTIRSVSDSKAIPAIGGEERFASGGFAVALTIEGGKPKIVINLSASKKQGMHLGADILQLAKVIK